MTNDSPKLSRMASRLIDLIADGEPHSIDDFVALFDDGVADESNVRPYLNEARQRLYMLGYGVLCEWPGKLRERATYRLVRHARLAVSLKRSLALVLNTSV